MTRNTHEIIYQTKEIRKGSKLGSRDRARVVSAITIKEKKKARKKKKKKRKKRIYSYMLYNSEHLR